MYKNKRTKYGTIFVSSWCQSQQPTSCFLLHTTNQNKAKILSSNSVSHSLKKYQIKERKKTKSSQRKVTDARSLQLTNRTSSSSFLKNFTTDTGSVHWRGRHGGVCDAGCSGGVFGVCSESEFILTDSTKLCVNLLKSDLKVLRVSFYLP